MGTFAGLLGHAASGFEEAHQADLQRQFTEEQGRRQTAHELFNQLAFDPNQPDEIRNAALQGKLDLTNTPLNKAYNFQKATTPLYDLLSKHKAAQMTAAKAPPQPGQITQGTPLNMPPPPPPGMATTQVPVGTHAQALPSGVAGPPQQVQNVPQISAPPRPLAFAGQSVQAPSSAPPPPPSFLAGIPQLAQNEATLGAAKSGGELTGQMEARSAMADRIMQDPQYAQMIQSDPMMQQMLMSMKMGVQLPVSYYGAMTKPLVSGSSIPGSDLIAEGVTKLDDGTAVDSSKFYNKRTLVGGRTGYAETAGKGQVAATGGGLQSPTTQHQQNAAINYGIWQKQNATQFGQRQALLNQAFQLGVNRGYLGDANKAFVTSVQDYGSALKTMKSMDEAYQTVQQNPNNQQAQVALLMSHIGMTLGVVKGARVGKAQIEEAENSRDMFAGAASKLNFDKDGNLNWSDPIRKGVTLTPDQMKSMVELGHQRMGILHDNIGAMHDALDPNQMGMQPIGTSFNQPSGAGRTKSRSGGPPPPPAKKQAYQLNGKWYDASTHQEIH